MFVGCYAYASTAEQAMIMRYQHAIFSAMLVRQQIRHLMPPHQNRREKHNLGEPAANTECHVLICGPSRFQVLEVYAWELCQEALSLCCNFFLGEDSLQATTVRISLHAERHTPMLLTHIAPQVPQASV